MLVNILDILYEQEFKKVSFNARKQQIVSKKVILSGPKRSGKSYIIFDRLSELEKEEFLYIDFNDIRVDKEFIRSNLKNFLHDKAIKVLVLENFDFSFEIPNCQEIIISTIHDISLDGFTNQKVYPLDFEEFISFNKAQINIKNLFNLYASFGTFPEIVLQDKINFVTSVQLLTRSFFENDTEFAIFKEFVISQGLKLSMFQVFNKIKQHSKISKDKFYNFTKTLQKQKILFLVDKFESPNAPKKIFLIDFAFKSALSFKKDFITRFENIVFLELLKKDKEMFYTDEINFYIPKEKKAILIYPFLLLNAILDKVKKLNLQNIKTVQIITLELEKSFTKNNTKFEIIPFWNWALQEESG